MFLPIDEKNKWVGKLKLIDIAIDVNNFIVRDVFSSVNFDMIVIYIQPTKRFKASGMLLIWNTKENKEFRSFSVEASEINFVNGLGS